MIEILTVIVLYVICPLLVVLIFEFLLSLFKGLGYKKAFDKKRRK